MDFPNSAADPASPPSDPKAEPGEPSERPPPSPTASGPVDTVTLDVDELEAQEALRWRGRPISELSDRELRGMATGEPVAEEPPDAKPLSPRERNWLKLRVTWPEKRRPLTLRVDVVVVEWFRHGGPGFQARMNAVLRAYVEAQMEAEAKRRR
jgi:uncharacterized protein (DUF4415 family)